MVEYISSLPLDNIFAALSDPTRRDILQRVTQNELSVSDIAEPYDMSLAAVSKHLRLLEKARLIIKRKRGKERLVSVNAEGLADADTYLQQYKDLWEQRLDSLGDYLESK